MPDFSDTGSITVMDAQCALCAQGARWIARNDRCNEFRIVPVQSVLGAALLRHYGLDPDDPVSWLYLEDGQAHTSLDAVIRVGRRLGGFWRILSAFMILPHRFRDRLYYTIASNRYRWFGQADMCALPDADVQKRLLK